jgi:hypothetical protein
MRQMAFSSVRARPNAVGFVLHRRGARREVRLRMKNVRAPLRTAARGSSCPPELPRRTGPYDGPFVKDHSMLGMSAKGCQFQMAAALRHTSISLHSRAPTQANSVPPRHLRSRREGMKRVSTELAMRQRRYVFEPCPTQSVNADKSPDRHLPCEQPRLGAHCPS